MIHPNLVYLGVFIQFVGGISYLVDTVKGNIQPNRVSWFLFTMAPALAFFAQLQQGVGPEIWATFIVGFVPFLILIATFVNKKAIWKLKKLDYICGALSLLGLILWGVTRVGNIAIIFAILADGLACVPTLVKSWYKPESESDSVFLLGTMNSAIGLLVITNWHFENYAFSTYMFLANLTLAGVIRFRIGKRFA
jgi:hypothetical protein